MAKWMKPLRAFTGLFRRGERQQAEADQRKSSLKKVDRSSKDASRSSQRLRFATEDPQPARVAGDKGPKESRMPRCVKDATKDAKEDSALEGFGGPIKAKPMQTAHSQADELSCHATAAYMSVTG
ncbi:dbp9 [Symbiodinium natans]|uniref:Dbp9 protein n=1 Tax=Symbiodinium natans TaxID=878477 RepID=A0A812PME0_9DINO|nr:dbp9 [Symbiodinium natans]